MRVRRKRLDNEDRHDAPRPAATLRDCKRFALVQRMFLSVVLLPVASLAFNNNPHLPIEKIHAFDSTSYTTATVPTDGMPASSFFDQRTKNNNNNGKALFVKKRIKKRPSTTMTLTSKSDRKQSGSRSKRAKQKLGREEKWNMMLDRLRDFRNEHGHAFVDESDCYHNRIPDGRMLELLHWTKSIRRNYRHQARNNGIASRMPRLCQDKLLELQRLDFVWDVQDFIWQQRFDQLCEYMQENDGDVKVPAYEPTGLGVWVRNQRREYRKLSEGQESTMSIERLQKLQSINFSWYNSHADSWNTRYRELLEYKEKYGDCNVPEDYTENFSLGQWCMNQRTAYRLYCCGEPTALTEKRISKLEDLGFEWHVRKAKWEYMLGQLQDFYHTHGHVNITSYMNHYNAEEEYNSLNQWLIVQRHQYQRLKDGQSSALTPERIQAIEVAVPDFNWKVRGAGGPTRKDWGKLFEAMRAKGIQPGMPAKQHWFDGQDRFQVSNEVVNKQVWTEQDLLALWNAEEEEDDGE